MKLGYYMYSKMKRCKEGYYLKKYFCYLLAQESKSYLKKSVLCSEKQLFCPLFTLFADL